jgi:glycosyltransferase involved in cell wall biosynthesis
MNILYLYAEVMPYTLSTIDELINAGHQVHIIQLDKKKLTMHAVSNAHYNIYNQSEYSYKQLRNFIASLSPDIIVVSGWMSLAYLKAAYFFKNKGILIVCALDTQWKVTFKKFASIIFFRIRFFNLFFDKYWIPGLSQYEFLNKIGVRKENIIYDLYSANKLIFKSKSLTVSKVKKFLFVGRLEESKQIEQLVNAFSKIVLERNDLKLTVIGSGSLSEKIKKISPGNISFKPFMSSKNLALQMSKHDCLILPSIYDPWGVVVHEAVSMGLALILSSEIGSRHHFLINNVNGFTFKAGDTRALEITITKFLDLSNRDILKFKKNSLALSDRITPKTSAFNLMSLLDRV